MGFNVGHCIFLTVGIVDGLTCQDVAGLLLSGIKNGSRQMEFNEVPIADNACLAQFHQPVFDGTFLFAPSTG